jgi:hypothetical protein
MVMLSLLRLLSLFEARCSIDDVDVEDLLSTHYCLHFRMFRLRSDAQRRPISDMARSTITCVGDCRQLQCVRRISLTSQYSRTDHETAKTGESVVVYRAVMNSSAVENSPRLQDD